MRIGLDLDGLLDERPEFFAFLTAALRGQGHFVAILTYRDPESRPRTQAQLTGWGVQCDELHFARSLRDKGRLCPSEDRRVLRRPGHDRGDDRLQDPQRRELRLRGERWLSTERLTRLL